MQPISSKKAYQNWNCLVESVLQNRPQIIDHRDDSMVLISATDLSALLSGIRYEATVKQEDDGSITLSLDALDLVVNAPTHEAAKRAMANCISEYAEDYYEDFEMYSAAPNRKGHLPFVIKALVVKKIREIAEAISCHEE